MFAPAVIIKMVRRKIGRLRECCIEYRLIDARVGRVQRSTSSYSTPMTVAIQITGPATALLAIGGIRSNASEN
jgi:hypothetical protein